MTEKDITICGHGSGHPSTKRMDEFLALRYSKKASNGVRKGIICVRRPKTMTDALRVKFHDKYKTILGRNNYNQLRRSYVYKKYKDGKYYSDCSSSGMDTMAKIGMNMPLYNTAGIYSGKEFETVPVKIKDGHITNPEILKVGDCLLFVGEDPKRPKQIGHVEYVYEIKKEKKGYSGEWPKLPTRGYFKNGDVSAEVCKLKKFLNWYGKYGLNESNKNYFDSTAAAVRNFQTKEKLCADGQFDAKALAKAKTIKK